MTYHATMHVGEKKYRVTTKADSLEEAKYKIGATMATHFPGQTVKIEIKDPEMVESKGLAHLKKILGLK